jgi:hypothetical protein
MIRLGLRLTVAGGREAVVRLLLITVAVMLGVGMLLATLAGVNAVNTQNARYGWIGSGADAHAPGRTAPTRSVDPAWWLLTGDEFDGTQIGRVDVAATGPRSPVPPGLARLPGPGQFYASPALAGLLRTVPRAELGARYPGTRIGTIGRAGLPEPGSLIIVIGHTPAQLAHLPRATEITTISTTPPSSCNSACYDIGIDANGIDLVLSVVAAALLFPVLIFIGTATRLSAARREQRFAAMRLVGATPRQVAVISAVESSVAAVTGVLAGFGVFFLFRPFLASAFPGTKFFVSDLSLNLLDVLAVGLGVPVAAAVAARIALRRVTISPLGVTRRATPKHPRVWRLLPLFAGLGELAWFAFAGRPATTPGQIQAFVTGILVTMAGLIIAGPWLTFVGARVLAGRTKRPAALIAGRRLADNPQAGFRAISGLVLALFVTSVAIGIITTITAYDGGTDASAAERHTLVDYFTTFTPSGPRDLRSIPDALVTELKRTPGVTGVTVVHSDAAENSLASCTSLAATPALGRCRPGARIVLVDGAYSPYRSRAEDRVLPPAGDVTSAQLDALPVRSIAIAAEGTGGIERARTVLQRAYPSAYSPTTIAEDRAQNDHLIKQYRQLALVVIVTSLPIAGCSLAVSVVAGLNDRKRPFSLLRLTGAPLSMLRRVVALESAVPLVVLAVVSIGTGFLAAGMFLDAQLDETLQAPSTSYYVIVCAGLLASLGVIASTLPMLRRLTGPEVARND